MSTYLLAAPYSPDDLALFEWLTLSLLPTLQCIWQPAKGQESAVWRICFPSLALPVFDQWAHALRLDGRLRGPFLGLVGYYSVPPLSF